MVPLPCTGSNVRSVDMQFTQVAYGGCWKCPQDWQRCSASAPCLAASQKGFVHSFGTGMGLVTLLQSLIVTSLPLSWVPVSHREAFLTHFCRRVNGALQRDPCKVKYLDSGPLSSDNGVGDQFMT